VQKGRKATEKRVRHRGEL
jgi:hypothetical protein